MSKIKSETSEIEGVFRIKIDIPFEVKFVCVYLFKLDEQLVMIDAGLNILPWKKMFLKELNKLNIEIKDIDYCIVTHEHLDHCGLLKYLKRKNPKIKIVMHQFTEESLRLTSKTENFGIMKKNAKIFAGDFLKYGIDERTTKIIMNYFLLWPTLIKYQESDILFKDDAILNFISKKLKIIWTPGHSIGHICIFNPQDSHLYSGDHILSRITPHIGIYHQLSLVKPEHLYPNILNEYLKSLDKIEKLKPKLIFPAHQEIITDPLVRIKAIKNHHQTRFREIKSIIKDNPSSPFKISQIHFGDDLDDMNKYLAMNEVLGHLIYLENKGEVTRIEKQDKIQFKV